MKILLDYFFPVTAIEPTPQASTSFLRQIGLVVKPKAASGFVDGDVELVTSMAQVTALTDNTDAQQLFDGGLNRLYLIASDDLALASTLVDQDKEFYTVIISSDYVDADLTAMDIGTYKGVVAIASDSVALLQAQAVIKNRVAFFSSGVNKGKNMAFAFASMLSNRTRWLNQQYILLPFDDFVTSLGDAELYFDSRISFVIKDDEFGNRLSMFAVGGKAIVQPYITKNLDIDMKSKALSYISRNMPAHTIKEASLIEGECQKVIDDYIADGSIEHGEVSVALSANDKFSADGFISISEPGAIWRIFGELTQV